MSGESYTKLHVLFFGLSLGIVWGVSMFLTGILAHCYGYGVEFVKLMGSIYVGYDVSIGGAVVGLVWGFLDLFIAGVIIALLYNYLCCYTCKKGGEGGGK